MRSDSAATASSATTVELHGVRRVFAAGLSAIDHVDLHVPAAQFLAVLGPSGCGKTTLLRIIAGLDKPDGGSIVTGPRSDTRAQIACVFQDAHLLPWRDALRNVALPLELMGARRAERLDAAAEALDHVGLADARHLYPAQLSGGMRMRVSLARALVTRPSLLLLDEPFAALDELTRHQLDEQLYRLWHDRRMTVIFVTHSIAEAAFLAERAVVLSRRPARVVLDHRVLLSEPRSARLRAGPEFARELGILYEALVRGQENASR